MTGIEAVFAEECQGRNNKYLFCGDAHRGLIVVSLIRHTDENNYLAQNINH